MTCDKMALFNLYQRRLLICASLVRVGATGVEPAAGWGIYRTGNFAADHILGPLRLGIRNWDSGHQCLSVRMQWLVD
jgi:hypothetical protein